MNSNIFFQPFVGKDYANGGIFGKRIMILGESHYCEEECVDCGDCRLHRECMDFTQHVLDDYLNENKERQNWTARNSTNYIRSSPMNSSEIPAGR